MPNNALTTWECMGCKSGGKGKLNTKEAKKAKDSSNAWKSDNEDVIITGISTGLTEKSTSLAKLNEEHHKLISSPHGWLDYDIIHAVHIFISYILRFRIKFCFVKKRFGFYFDQSERRNEFLTREKIVSSNHKPRFKRIVFSRAFSRSSRVALSGSFDKILYFRCTRVVRNSNFQVIKS